MHTARHAKREEMKAKRKRARDRWHKAMRMVSRANRVKKITGMIKFVPPAKGQSLNERLQTLENASRKNTSAIARMENSIEALNDSVTSQSIRFFFNLTTSVSFSLFSCRSAPSSFVVYATMVSSPFSPSPYFVHSWARHSSAAGSEFSAKRDWNRRENRKSSA
jgi:hypothetical protein